jgi:hypothetical protein
MFHIKQEWIQVRGGILLSQNGVSQDADPELSLAHDGIVRVVFKAKAKKVLTNTWL